MDPTPLIEPIPFEGALSYWILQTIAMLITAALIPKLRITGALGATLTVMALAAVNATVWDAALFLSVPSGATTQAATLLLANGAIFWILVKVLPGIEIEGIWPAFVAPIVFTVVSLVIDRYGRQIDWMAVIQYGVALVEQLRDSLMGSGGAPTGAQSPPSPSVP